jgi:hypothetical protein
MLHGNCALAASLATADNALAIKLPMDDDDDGAYYLVSVTFLAETRENHLCIYAYYHF